MKFNKKFVKYLGAVFFMVMGGACTKNTSTPSQPVVQPAVNTMSVGVNDLTYCSTNSYINKPCVTVTVCSENGSNCTVIKDILLDSGSYGLRVFKEVIPKVTLGTSRIGAIAECIEYGDGSKQWGPVGVATVQLGSEPSVVVPIQSIDSTFRGMNANCANAETYSNAGLNGILGVGLFQSDCGSNCANSANNGIYFDCSGSTCVGAKVPEANQVQNPVAMLPVDNNGVILQFPAVPLGGQTSLVGTLIFGIGTRTNNVPSAGVTRFVADGNGEMTTSFNGSSYLSFIDSGSNGLTFPSIRGLPDCGGLNAGWFCPASVTTYSANNISTGGAPLGNVLFKVGNFNSLYGTANRVFVEVGNSSGGNLAGFFDWGLPFYFGRSVYLGIEGRSSSLGAGTYWAY